MPEAIMATAVLVALILIGALIDNYKRLRATGKGALLGWRIGTIVRESPDDDEEATLP